MRQPIQRRAEVVEDFAPPLWWLRLRLTHDEREAFDRKIFGSSIPKGSSRT